MKHINTYIIEKLKINKNTNNISEFPSYKEFYDLVYNINDSHTVLLEDIFEQDKMPKIKSNVTLRAARHYIGRNIVNLHIFDAKGYQTLCAGIYDKNKFNERVVLINMDKIRDILSDDDIMEIYNYMISNVNNETT